AIGRAKVERGVLRPGEFAARAWPGDRGVELILRAAVSPMTIASSEPLATVGPAFLAALVPLSAGADLLERGIQLNFGGAASISVPNVGVPSADFVGEELAIPLQPATTFPGPTLTPHKLAVMTSLTGEMMRHSNAETLVRQALIESTGPAIDRQLFSTTAAGQPWTAA